MKEEVPNPKTSIENIDLKKQNKGRRRRSMSWRREEQGKKKHRLEERRTEEEEEEEARAGGEKRKKRRRIGVGKVNDGTRVFRLEFHVNFLPHQLAPLAT